MARSDRPVLITGGTGFTGSYVARQRPLELGGDGTAEFLLTVTVEEGRHG